MLITVDRLQFINQQLICFEFFDIKKDINHFEFIKNKIQYLNNGRFCDVFHLVQYDIANLQKIYVGQGTNKVEHTFSSFQNWFLDLNQIANTNRTHSKALGTADKPDSDSDNYVQSLLNIVYRNDVQYNNLNFFTDDNGLEMVTKTLDGQSTYGFDFDLYETESQTVIEFLKRNSDLVTNLTSHPIRYPKNKGKFVSLWHAAQRLNPYAPKLYCVNYSDDEEEAISIIQVLDFDTGNNKKMVTSDIGYKLENKNELIEWLNLLNNDYNAAFNYLQQKPKEIRDNQFFDDVYEKNKKYLIGKNYK